MFHDRRLCTRTSYVCGNLRIFCTVITCACICIMSSLIIILYRVLTMSPMSPCSRKEARVYANQQKIYTINTVLLSTSPKILQLLQNRSSLFSRRKAALVIVIGEIDTLASKMLRHKRVESESSV